VNAVARGRYDEAAISYEDAYERAPNHPDHGEGVVGLGRGLHAQGKREEALSWLERGLSIRQAEGATDPERAEAAFALEDVDAWLADRSP